MDLARWLIEPATRGLEVDVALDRLVDELNARGLELTRVRLSIPTLHPEIGPPGSTTPRSRT